MAGLHSFGSVLLWVLIKLLEVYSWIIVISAIVSWFLLPPTNPVIRFLRFITEPVLNPCRQILYRILPFSWRRFDFSPLLALLAIWVVRWLLGLFIVYY
jgi:YggT family protein